MNTANAPLPLWSVQAPIFLQPDDLPPFEAGQWLHVCSIALSAEPSRSSAFAAMEQIKHTGGSVSFDP